MSRIRLAGLVSLVAGASFAGGCAVYSTPSGDVVGPAPLVVSPPAVVVSPSVHFGYRYYHHPRYHAPRYYGRGYGAPRYYGRPYYHY